MTTLTPDQVDRLLQSKGPGTTIYLVGAGGCGMSALGHLFLDLGHRIAGSDQMINPEVLQLLARGALIHPEHLAEHVKAARPILVVFSSAIRPDNLELKAAQALQVPTVRRGIVLAALARRQRCIAVAGMHGKTTTTALLAFALQQLQITSSYAVGAQVPQFAAHARFVPCVPSQALDAQPYFVLEADESDGTLREFQVEHAIILNLDAEHLDFYRDLEAVAQEFQAFASQIRGKLIYCADDPVLTKLFSGHPQAVSYGFASSANYRIEPKSASALPACSSQISSHFEIWQGRERLGEFGIKLLGSKNISNAAAVIALLHQLNLPAFDIALAIRSFRGASRRQQELYRDHRYRVIEDYAHHPNEIRATLEALKGSTRRRLLVAFQPHRFTRTQCLMKEFAACFQGADQLWLTDIYPASESPIAGVSGEALAESVRQQGQSVEYLPALEALRSRIRAAMQPGDCVLFLGAGDITKTAHQLKSDLQHESARERDSLCAQLSSRLSPTTVLRKDEKLAKRTTLRVGGRADLYVEPASETELAEVVKFCAERQLPFMILGRGSNLLIQDHGIRGVVICLAHPQFCRVETQAEEVHCGAGAKLKAVATAARHHGLSGLEFLEGIPGSVGGALRMNAGAMGGSMFQIVKSIRFMDFTGAIHERKTEDLKVEYRSCPLFKQNIALAAVLKGQPAPRQEIAAKMKACSQKRWASQPAAPSAGCIFKNPPAVPAGKLIEELGLKGMRVGGAMVSEVHGNFIINEGYATAQDVLGLIELIKIKARAARGIELETEVEIIGENFNDEGTT